MPHPLDLRAQRVVEAVDRAGLGAQHRIAELADLRERRRAPRGDLGVELRLLPPRARLRAAASAAGLVACSATLFSLVRGIRVVGLVGRYCGSTSTLTLTPRAAASGPTASTAAPTAAIAARRSVDLSTSWLRGSAPQPKQRRRPEHARPRRVDAIAQGACGGEAQRPARSPSRRPGSAIRTADSPAPCAARARRPGTPRSRGGTRTRSSARPARASARARGRPPAPRPARPASCVISANVRSSARKSGKRSVWSASSTTPSVTSAKSWPLATICVPTSTPAGAASNRASVRRERDP